MNFASPVSVSNLFRVEVNGWEGAGYSYSIPEGTEYISGSLTAGYTGNMDMALADRDINNFWIQFMMCDKETELDIESFCLINNDDS